MSIGKISSLPASIPKLSRTFERSEKMSKLPIGPAGPSPGPTFDIQLTTEAKVVSKSYPSRETSATRTKVSRKYSEMNTSVLRIVEVARVCPFIRTLLVRRGLSILPISWAEVLKNMMIRETFIPPPVLPAEAPINMTMISMLLEKAGQSVKSAVAKPVVVINDDTWKSE